MPKPPKRSTTAPLRAGITPPPPSILLRARITPDEWTDMRKQALDENRAPADLVGDAIRSYLKKGQR